MAIICFTVIAIIGVIVMIATQAGRNSETRKVSSDNIRSPKTHGKMSRWIPKEVNVKVAGIDIGGMVYVGHRPGTDYRDGEVIYTGLPAAKRTRDYAGDKMPYWPRYADLAPEARATYLEWLSTERADPRFSVGYVLLYFYGLERRYFTDNASTEERAQIIAEVRRLLDVYGANGSVNQYLESFLDCAGLPDPNTQVQPVLDLGRLRLPVRVRVSLGRMLAAGMPLTWDWLLSWYICDPDTRLRTAPRRAFEEFKVYFGYLFDQKYPNGYKVRAPKSRLALEYRAASNNFVVNLTEHVRDIPDIRRLKVPLRVAEDLARSATDGLDKYSRFLGRFPERKGSIQAHALLPEPIWSLYPCAEVQQLRAWAEDRVRAGGFVPVVDLIAQIDGQPPDKILKSQLMGAARALAIVGLGMSPDPRFALQKPRLNDPVYLFRLPEDLPPIESPGDAYQLLTLKTSVAAFVAAADGQVDQAEKSLLSAEITQHEGLSEAERIRQQAYLTWLLEVPPRIGMLRSRLRSASEDLIALLSRMAILIAGADGIIAPDEVRVIKRLYGAMGLDPEGVSSDLHALSVSTGPVVVRPADTGPTGYAIPKPPLRKPKGTIVLDPERIKMVKEETARAQAVLTSVFTDEEESTEPDPIVPEHDPNEVLVSLDQQHRAMVMELMTRPIWTESELTELAGQYNLMAFAALEIINEWAHKHFEEAIIEEDEDFQINGEILKQIRDS
ncbi:MAG: TerB N-terminal domain-containing protein [Bacteroidota bacterium]|nr:TerB N-terminal domain-containing protein [Bacteroidota bacterium]